MGLDVYLYRCKDVDALNAYEKKQSDAHDSIYNTLKQELGLGEKDQLTDAQWKTYNKRSNAWDKENPAPEGGDEKEVQRNSEKHPEHMFKVGYFRSSYNDGGINSILRAAIGQDLYSIFVGEGRPEQYRFAPDWKASLERAKAVREAFTDHLNRVGSVKVIDVGPNFFLGEAGLPKSKEEVMKLFTPEQERHNERFKEGKEEPFATKDANWYSNRDGSFFLGKGARLLAAIPGKGFGGKTTTYLVIRDGEESEIEKNWYLQALDVVVETCEYVLRHKNPEEYIFHWSA